MNEIEIIELVGEEESCSPFNKSDQFGSPFTALNECCFKKCCKKYKKKGKKPCKSCPKR